MGAVAGASWAVRAGAETAAAFCRRESVSTASLFAWRRRLITRGGRRAGDDARSAAIRAGTLAGWVVVER